MLKRLYDKLGTYVHSQYATPLLAILFFIESIFFIPVDPLLMLYCMERQKRALWYAFIATISSVAGGIMAYGIGLIVWDTIGQLLVNHIISQQLFDRVVQAYAKHEALVILTAGFTPLPYKAITLSAGFCNIPFIPFVGYSFIARGARFFLIAGLMHFWGAQIKEYIDRYFNLFVLLFVALLIGALWIIY